MTVASEGRLEITPLSGAIGAEITGIDLSRPLADVHRAVIRSALLEWKAVFFRDQHLDHASQVAFAKHFGTPLPVTGDSSLGVDSHPEVFQVKYEYAPFDESAAPHVQQWHVDGSETLRPPAAIVIRTDRARPYGGDTNFTNLAAAYRGLPRRLREFAAGLRAVNRFPAHLTRGSEARLRALEANPVVTEHSVVRVHPETGEPALFVTPTHAQAIVGLTPRQSRSVLDLFFEQINKPEYVVRFRWEPGSVALWDNRSAAHYAPNDLRHLGHRVEERLAFRVALAGDVPLGADGRWSVALRPRPEPE
jgi:alpha-ketoglutarate-dependent taurine dioxygenase